MTEFALTPELGHASDPDVWRVVTTGQVNPLVHSSPQIGVWTVPARVRSFTLQIGGAPATPVTADLDPPQYPIVQAVIYDVPCTPGDLWLLEGGQAGTGENALRRGTLHGGDGRMPSFPTTDTDYGLAGGGASILWRRRTSDEVAAIHGGQGGEGVDSDGTRIPEIITDEAPPGALTVGGFTTLAGASVGADQAAFDAGGGGGGVPGGAAGPALARAGESGGSYLPALPQASAGGPPSPTAIQIAAEDTYEPQGFESGIVAIWYKVSTPRRRGWVVGMRW